MPGCILDTFNSEQNRQKACSHRVHVPFEELEKRVKSRAYQKVTIYALKIKKTNKQKTNPKKVVRNIGSVWCNFK